MVLLRDAPLEHTETSGALGGKRKGKISAVQRRCRVEEGAYPGQSLSEGHWSSNTKFSGLLDGRGNIPPPPSPSSSTNC